MRLDNGMTRFIGRTCLWLMVAWAAAVYVNQVVHGLTVTNLSRPVYWGLYITNFVFCVGLSAGGIVVSAIVHLLDRVEMRPLAIMAEIMATLFLALAVAFVVVDMGRPTALFEIVLHPQVRSPLLWDVTVISVYGLLCVGLLYFSTREQILRRGTGVLPGWLITALTLGRRSQAPASLARDHRILKVLALASLPLAVALHSVTAWILGLQISQPGWTPPILAPVFIASAIASGVAAVTLAAIAARKVFSMPVSDDALRTLGSLLAVSIPLLSYLLLSEFLTVGLSGSPRETGILQDLLWGRFAPIFWFDAVVGLFLPLLVLALPGRWTVQRIGAASTMVLIGVLAERAYLVLPSLLRVTGFAPTGRYHPTYVEWSLMAGAYAAGTLLFLAAMDVVFGARRTPVTEVVGLVFPVQAAART